MFMLYNSQKSIFNSKIFPGVIPRIPVKKGEGQEAGCVMAVEGSLDATLLDKCSAFAF